MIKFSQNPRGFVLPLIAIVGLIFAVLSVLGRKSPPINSPSTLPPISKFDNNVAGIGVVEPASEVIAVGTELPGIVRTVHIKVGDLVKNNQPLFTLDERDIDAQIKIQEATLEVAKIQAQDAAAQFALVKDITDQRAVAKDDYNQRKFGSELAKAKIVEIQAQLERSKTTKDRLTIQAPIDGEILSVNVRKGEYAAAGVLSEPLIRIGDTSVLHVRVEIDEENSTKINPKETARGFQRGDTTNEIPLTFVRIEPYVRAKQNLAVSGQRVDTRVLQIIYSFSGQQNKVFVGQQLDVFIPTTEGVKK